MVLILKMLREKPMEREESLQIIDHDEQKD